MTLIKTNDPSEYGKTRSTGIGAVTFDEDGIADVNPDDAQTLTQVSSSLSLVTEVPFQEDKNPLLPNVDSTFIEANKLVVDELGLKQGDQLDLSEGKVDQEIEDITEAFKTPVEFTIQPTTVTEITEEVVEQASSIVVQDDITSIQSESKATEAEVATIKAALEEKNMSELRSYLIELNVDESEFSQFKGKDAKPGLIEFILTKI